jgi:hypothetical protein
LLADFEKLKPLKMDASIGLEESQGEIASYIRSLVVEPDFSIVSGTTLFKVHRAILGPSSNFLLNLFMVGWELIILD